VTQPRPLREDDTLGRAGRTNANGKPVKAQRVRDIDPEDERRVAIETIGFDNPRLVITERLPLADETGQPLPVVEETTRGLRHLDSKSEPRPPKSWEKANADLRAGKFKDEREAMTRALRRERDAMTLAELAAAVAQEMLVNQSQRAVQVRATDAKSAEGRDQAPQGEGHGALGHFMEVEADRHLLQARRHIEAVAEMLDVHHGRANLSYVLMSKEEKDALLLGPRFRGLSPEEIYAIEPLLGAPKTIRDKRSKGGQTGRGLPKPERQERAA
jgi:hypothetical protein